jgi:branched-chain amino acid transport system permease protein
MVEFGPQPTKKRNPRLWVSDLALLVLIASFWPISKAFDANLDPYYLDLIIRVGVAIILAVSLNLINGITGQFSLGHAGFMAVGAYTAAVLLKHSPPQGSMIVPMFLGCILLGGFSAAIVGMVVGVPTLRLRGDYLAIATLGFGQIITVVLTQIDSIGSFEVGGASGLHGVPILTNFFWTYAWVVVCVVIIWRLVHSAKGKPFFAVREDEVAAAAMGIDTTYYKVAAFVGGAFFAGVAGVLSACFIGNVAPKSFDFMRSIEIVVMVVLGGSGSISGAILAAIVLTVLPEYLRFLEDWRLVIYALVLIIMMLVRPEGLLGNRELWWTRRRLKPAQAPDSMPPASI